MHAWTRDIEITADQRARNLRNAGIERARKWVEFNRTKRLGYQEEGRRRARRDDTSHEAGCMVYWAEGAKDRGEPSFCNSDRAMVAFFWRFPTSEFAIVPERVRIRLNVYLNNGLSLDEIEDWWNEVLRLPKACFRNHVVNHYPTSSSGQRPRRLPYGVCTIRYADTRIVQHIFGAIQEYAGFEEPRWVDGRPGRCPSQHLGS